MVYYACIAAAWSSVYNHYTSIPLDNQYSTSGVLLQDGCLSIWSLNKAESCACFCNKSSSRNCKKMLKKL